MKQTAVEWLEEELKCILGDIFVDFNFSYTIEQAKQMEKEQITTAYKIDMDICSDEDAEEYYNGLKSKK